MTERVSDQARRRFLRMAVAGAAALPVCALTARRLRAQEKVDPSDEVAQQLGYVEDASEVDAEEWPNYEDGQLCSNCDLYEAAEGDEWGPCQIFGGDLVAAGGWCSAWVEQQA
ncbi:MAG: high-potential iron-sulfur protein [Geminicoccaceae bacterium]|nr:high-potential iron-sulfur protein [Geminicoccaceae bacterium]